MAEKPEPMLTADEVKEWLGYDNVATIHRMAVAGEIPCYKIGREWKFRRHEVAEWIDKKAPGAESLNL